MELGLRRRIALFVQNASQGIINDRTNVDRLIFYIHLGKIKLFYCFQVFCTFIIISKSKETKENILSQ